MSTRSLGGTHLYQPLTDVVHTGKQKSISALLLSCLKSFQGLVAKTKDPLTTTDAHDQSSIWADELGRLRIWAANIGAHQSGQSSLDYRLRDASHISEQIKTLIRDLRQTIREIEDLLREEESPPSSPGVEPPVEGNESENELQQLHGDVKSIISCLFQMSMLVRKPAHHDLWTDAENAGVSIFEPFDLEHIKNKFPQADERLVQRLAHSMTRRREILKYRERHHQKLSEGLDCGEAERKDDGISQMSPTVATTFRPGMESHPQDGLTKSVYTQTSFALSFLYGGEVTVPPPPKESEGGAVFECPYCFFMISVRDSQAWYKHLFSDLLPYVCPILSCSTPYKMYPTQHEWARHLRLAHPTDWPPASSHTSSSNAEPIDTVPMVSCHLCASPSAAGKIAERHLARHLLEVACFALPRAVPDSDGSDPGSETNVKINEEALASTGQATDDESNSSDEPVMLSRFVDESREDTSDDDIARRLDLNTARDSFEHLAFEAGDPQDTYFHPASTKVPSMFQYKRDRETGSLTQVPYHPPAPITPNEPNKALSPQYRRGSESYMLPQVSSDGPLAPGQPMPSKSMLPESIPPDSSPSVIRWQSPETAENFRKSLATFQCSICHKRFTRAYNLHSHLRTHNERPLACTICGKAFARQQDRKRHERLHSGQKIFACQGELANGVVWGCGQHFMSTDALEQHFRSRAGKECIRPKRDEDAIEREQHCQIYGVSAPPEKQEGEVVSLRDLPERPDRRSQGDAVLINYLVNHPGNPS